MLILSSQEAIVSTRVSVVARRDSQEVIQFADPVLTFIFAGRGH